MWPPTPPNPTPTPISTQAPTPPNSTSKGVAQPRDQQLPHVRTSRPGVVSTWAIGFRRLRLHSRAARSGGSRSGSGPTPPFTHRTLREGCSALATPPPLCMRGGGRFGPTSHLGGRSTSPTTLHAKRRWSSKSAATLPEGAVGEGEGRAAPTPAATTPCSAAAKA